MDAMKLLGELLGTQSMARGGVAENILKTILSGSPSSTAPEKGSSNMPHSQPRAMEPLERTVEPMRNWDAPARSPADVMRRGGTANQRSGGSVWGGLIGDAVQRYGQRPGVSEPSSTRATRSQQQYPSDTPESHTNSDAEVLVRAMINAAKSDGQIDQAEQDRIVSKLGNLSHEEVNFLRHEFSQPLNVQQFIRQVPPGLEHQVYALSLTAIDLDTNREATYLHELAQGLKIDPETCNQIHAQLGAPLLYG